MVNDDHVQGQAQFENQGKDHVRDRLMVKMSVMARVKGRSREWSVSVYERESGGNCQ